jgi:excisionase family DNA binding protein
MDLMTKQAVVEDLNVSERTLEKWVRDGKFPTPVRMGKRAYWDREAVERWKRMAFAYQLNFRPK